MHVHGLPLKRERAAGAEEGPGDHFLGTSRSWSRPARRRMADAAEDPQVQLPDEGDDEQPGARPLRMRPKREAVAARRVHGRAPRVRKEGLGCVRGCSSRAAMRRGACRLQPRCASAGPRARGICNADPLRVHRRSCCARGSSGRGCRRRSRAAVSDTVSSARRFRAGGCRRCSLTAIRNALDGGGRRRPSGRSSIGWVRPP